jgi:hypothetical protein
MQAPPHHAGIDRIAEHKHVVPAIDVQAPPNRIAGGASDAQLCYSTLYGNSPPTMCWTALVADDSGTVPLNPLKNETFIGDFRLYFCGPKTSCNITLRSSSAWAQSPVKLEPWDVNTKDLEAVADLLDGQQLVVRIGQVLPLGDARQAHEVLEGLRPLPAGKVVLNAPGDSTRT